MLIRACTLNRSNTVYEFTLPTISPINDIIISVGACVCACVRACMCACVHACMFFCVHV